MAREGRAITEARAIASVTPLPVWPHPRHRVLVHGDPVPGDVPGIVILCDCGAHLGVYDALSPSQALLIERRHLADCFT